jgi:AbrB family looped-hinge helix DNA binding protein
LTQASMKVVVQVVKTMTIGGKGQVVIPAEIRRAIGLQAGQRVQVRCDDGEIVLRPVPTDLLAALRGSLRDGPSLTEALAREHAEEIERDERRSL